MSVAPGPLQFFLTRLCDMLLYLHKTKCLANVGRGHLVSLFHKHNVGPSSSTTRDVPAAQCVCTAGCDRCSRASIRADTSLTIPITTPLLHKYVRNDYYNVGKTPANTELFKKKKRSCGEININLNACSVSNTNWWLHTVYEVKDSVPASYPIRSHMTSCRFPLTFPLTHSEVFVSGLSEVFRVADL